MPSSCALLGGFAIDARVALPWQHNANPSYKLASIPRYDDIVRTAGWAGSASAAGRRPAGAPKIARRIRHAGAAGPSATGRRQGPAVLNITAAVWNAGFPLVAFWQQKANAKC